jgi:hypothetical protein
MAKKEVIHPAEAAVMKRLYASELNKAGMKTAGSEDPQAFEDHKKMIDTLKEVLADDASTSWSENDPLLD